MLRFALRWLLLNRELRTIQSVDKKTEEDKEQGKTKEKKDQNKTTYLKWHMKKKAEKNKKRNCFQWFSFFSSYVVQYALDWWAYRWSLIVYFYFFIELNKEWSY